MTITVIGHLCLDVIHLPPTRGKARLTQSYGGIFFAVAALANLVDQDATIYPVLGVGKKEYSAFIERLSIYPNVDPSGIFAFDGRTNEVHLSYHGEKRRTECSKHIAEPISFKRIKPYLDADMILINMISGFDIALETLDQLRMAVRQRHVPIYFDLHSLSLGIREDSTRFHRPLPDWRRWFFWLHAVQMNEEEAAGVTAEKLTEEYFAKQVTALNTPVLILTRGSDGCTVYVDDGNHLLRHDLPGIPVNRSIDATGCGDVLGAAYCANYLVTQDSLKAAEFANTVAASNAASVGSTEIDKLAKFKSRFLSGRESLSQAALHPGGSS